MAGDGVRDLVDRFDTHPIVALGEMHGVEQGARFVEDLVRDLRFSENVDAIVVEFGNARHQAICDAYVAGGDVASTELRQIWQDFAGAGPWGFRAPIYPRFFATVREVNQTLPAKRRTRVLLGDPPLDWSSARTWQDLATALEDRDAHFARVVESEVLRCGKRALVLAGAYHLFKATWPPFTPGTGLVQILERDHPGSTYVVLPHDNLRPRDRVAIATKLATYSVPLLAHIAGSWIDDLPAGAFLGGRTLTKMDGSTYDPFDTCERRMGELGDALLYLGPFETLTSSPDDLHPHDEADRAELRRRIALWDPRLAAEDLAALDG